MPWNDNLDGQPLEIASCTEPLVRVMAGPGTGKTFALIRRLAAKLTEPGQDPRRVLLITFTRVSATDLERELNSLGLPRGGQVTKGTLHSLCFSILHRSHVFEFTQRAPRPLLKYEERFLLEDLSKYGQFGTIYERRNTLKAFEAAWARTLDQQPGWPTTSREQLFQAALEEWLRFHQCLLIEELIPLTLRYLMYNPGCPELLQYDHVFVDEYQDLNKAEQALIDLLAQGRSLTIVGDQDQAIYEGFRYAHPEGIRLFHETHQGTRDIPLDVSRRCPPAIVLLANSLIQHNLRRSDRELIPVPNAAEVNVALVHWPDMQTEAKGLADYIATRINSGEYDPGRILILCPRRQFGYQIRDQLRSKQVDAISFFHEEELEGNPKDLTESEAQQSFSLLTLLSTPEDQVALRAWLGFGSPNLRVNEYKRLRDYCAEHGQSLFDVLQAIHDGRLTIPHCTGTTARFALLIERLRELGALQAREAFNILFPPNEGWAEPFRTIYNQAGESLNYADTLDFLRTNITQPELPTTATYVRIMSLHKSKGLTADHVFIPGCVEGLVPSYPRDSQHIPFEEQRRFHEEQRRLFYVAITRARHTLVLSSTQTLPRDLAHKMGAKVVGRDPINGRTIASTFLADLGRTCPRSELGQQWLQRP
jgi:DNA helicase II / ATP-dependent DNA helicase PcrA